MLYFGLLSWNMSNVTAGRLSGRTLWRKHFQLIPDQWGEGPGFWWLQIEPKKH